MSKRVAQLAAIIRLEVRKAFLSKRSIPIYILALLPVLVFAGRALLAPQAEDADRLGHSVTLYGVVFQSFILRTCIFFGCVGIFTNLFRGEILDRSLHFYFLAPVRRETLVFGKYIAGLLAAIVLFSGTTAATLLLNYVPHGRALALEHLLRGPGLGHLVAYLGVTALACLGYGAVFLAIGLFFRNPVVPAVLILGWESIIFLLPPLLKKISVIYYLQSLCPFQIPQGPVAILAEPSPLWLAVPGIIGVTVVLLVIAARRARRLEIMYGAE